MVTAPRISPLKPAAAGAAGILDARYLPDPGFGELWEALVVAREFKDRLLCQALLNFTLRPVVKRADVPLHGVILLTGVPGTGKSSLARALASRTAESIPGPYKFVYLADPPALGATMAC